MQEEKIREEIEKLKQMIEVEQSKEKIKIQKEKLDKMLKKYLEEWEIKLHNKRKQFIYKPLKIW